MTEARAKKRLRRLLRSFTAGTLLHLLADLFQEAAARARAAHDRRAVRRYRRAAQALFVVGLGIDAACPR